MRLRAVRSVHTNKLKQSVIKWFSSVSHFLSIKCLGKSILSIDFGSDEKRKVRLQMVNPLEQYPLNRYPLPRWDPFFPLGLRGVSSKGGKKKEEPSGTSSDARRTSRYCLKRYKWSRCNIILRGLTSQHLHADMRQVSS